MRKARLSRYWSDEQGSPGYLITPGFWCATLELPWRGNKQNFSCIPSGIYLCTLRFSQKFGWCYHITGVPDRTYILTHSGNLAGDRLRGYKTHTYGCVLQGKYRGKLEGQRAVLYSKPIVRQFMTHMNKEDFELEIINRF